MYFVKVYISSTSAHLTLAWGNTSYENLIAWVYP